MIELLHCNINLIGAIMLRFDLDKNFQEFEATFIQVRDYWIDFTLDLLKKFKK